ncbi:alpha-ketoacid dehydrogenase subunit alpha/beta [Flavilitoribacter nigricans]|uniref:3-methyl-2-oxobutanoate dehydrogenase (2-methylpropanoyl-transferring) n=1 Tax=Flavilitoribacter nigricans (strain ATCC 23147 / DSM 23189 / NBRC 102662 / NCIMB 1420 / SS-2) TaxID=1122177 RepID=A0A2D0NHA9_FLAN2|nr:alpha-ketoacid dehydrogenase subunit alpha/beta [Flavilitoribacter nigricans]PHN07153.1 tungsten formylmethanofuran dehydrogenase [Flavilitoribacter nigricans DSM 23189 = NBRC 102662]
MIHIKHNIARSVLKRGFRLMATAKAMTRCYEQHFQTVSKYVHATSRGHEAVQIGLGLHLGPEDWVSPYYRDDALLLSIGMSPYDLMLQLLAKKDDPFSGGRTYYAHPSLNDPDKPKIIHQSSATGMQAIPTTGVAMGLQYREKEQLPLTESKVPPVVVCSLGDASVTEGEVAEAFQMAALWQLPILFLVQDNEWDISAHAAEIRAQNAREYARGFHGLESLSIDGSDFVECYSKLGEVIHTIRDERRPFLVHASVPLLNHHTSGVRKEWYRDDLEEQSLRDPYPLLRTYLEEEGFSDAVLDKIENEVQEEVDRAYEIALTAEDPEPEDLFTHDFASTPVTEEKGRRTGDQQSAIVMVDCALHAMEEILREHPEALFYGQDVGARLGGVFREAANLAKKFGDNRVFNTAIQEAFIIGSTVGMSAVGLKPIVEVQFADYLWPGLNQLFSEVSRSCYLSNGKWPVSMVLRVPVGAYGGGGPYHSSSMESVLTNIQGIKIAYPSNGADLKGLLKAAFYDPNPVVVFEHKGLYWSKVPGTETARCVEPDADYILPLGKGRMVQTADTDRIETGESALIVTYGMGVHWALGASKQLPGQLSILDLRSLYPLDEDLIYEQARRHGRILVVTEESVDQSFARSLAARIQENCFESLDAPVRTVGSENVPAIPLNEKLEKAMLLSSGKVAEAAQQLLAY